MPLFHFHLSNGDGWTYDHEGRTLSSVDEAMANALKEAPALIADAVLNGKPVRLASFISIGDEDGNEIARLTFDRAVELE